MVYKINVGASASFGGVHNTEDIGGSQSACGTWQTRREEPPPHKRQQI
jgi:hypothetical protein